MKLNTKVKDYEEVKIQDAVFKVKPLDFFKIAEIQSKYEHRGKIPKDKEVQYFAEILEESIIGWENIEDEVGKVVFSKEKIRPVITALFQQGYAEEIYKIVEAAMKLFMQVENEKKK